MATLGSNRAVTFALIGENPGGFSFNAYTMHHDDSRVEASADGISVVEGNVIDRSTGKPAPKRFKWPSGKRVLHLHNKKEIEHVRNSPFCEGSPFKPARPKFRVLDKEKDAKLIVDDAKLTSKAEYLALHMELDQLKFVSNVYGCFEDSEHIQRKTLLHHAKTDPKGFIAQCEDDLIEIRSLLSACISEGIIKEEGSIVTWAVEGKPSMTLGVTREKAVAKIYEDGKINEGLRHQLSAIRKAKKR